MAETDHAFDPDKVCLLAIVNILSKPHSFRTKAVTSNWTVLVSFGMSFGFYNINECFFAKETKHTIDIVPKQALRPVLQARRAVMGDVDTESEIESTA